MRVIVDTNVLVSGLLWRGPPHAVLEQIRSGALKFVSSPALLAEFAEVIRRPKFEAILSRAGIEPADLEAKVRELAEVTDPPPLLVPVCRDPDDDALLALAVAAQADLIIFRRRRSAYVRFLFRDFHHQPSYSSCEDRLVAGGRVLSLNR